MMSSCGFGASDQKTLLCRFRGRGQMTFNLEDLLANHACLFMTTVNLQTTSNKTQTIQVSISIDPKIRFTAFCLISVLKDFYWTCKPYYIDVHE